MKALPTAQRLQRWLKWATIIITAQIWVVYEYIIYYTTFEQEIPIGDLLLIGQVFGVKHRTLPMYVYKNNAIGIVLIEIEN